MLSDYSTDELLTTTDIATIRGIPKLEVEKAISVFGIPVANTYRAGGKAKGRPSNLYRRDDVEALFVVVIEYKRRFGVVDAAAEQAASAVSALGNQATAQAA